MRLEILLFAELGALHVELSGQTKGQPGRQGVQPNSPHVGGIRQRHGVLDKPHSLIGNGEHCIGHRPQKHGGGVENRMVHIELRRLTLGRLVGDHQVVFLRDARDGNGDRFSRTRINHPLIQNVYRPGSQGIGGRAIHRGLGFLINGIDPIAVFGGDFQGQIVQGIARRNEVFRRHSARLDASPFARLSDEFG